jgi:hypothetical protein
VGVINGDYLNLYGRTRDIGTVGNELSTLGDALTAAARAEGMTVRADPDDIARALLPVGQLSLRARRHSRHPDRERGELRGSAAGMGGRAEEPLLDRAVSSARRSARRLDVG